MTERGLLHTQSDYEPMKLTFYLVKNMSNWHFDFVKISVILQSDVDAIGPF
jgi:hypothetical protein